MNTTEMYYLSCYFKALPLWWKLISYWTSYQSDIRYISYQKSIVFTLGSYQFKSYFPGLHLSLQHKSINGKALFWPAFLTMETMYLQLKGRV